MTTTLAPPPPAGWGVHGVSPLELRALSDDALLDLQRTLAERRRLIDAESSLVAAEISERSRRELGNAGLAQQRGMRTPEALVQQLTGLSGADARTLVRVGTLVSEHSAPTSTEHSWLAPVTTAIAAGHLTLEAADAIRAGLGEPCDGVTAQSLAEAAACLVRDAASVTVERLAALARRTRDDLDEAGVAEREAQRRERRYLTLTSLPDGMTRISGLLDPESAAIVVGAVDVITSPRRGGPRFVTEGEQADPTDDTRTIPQMVADALVDLVRVATLADDRALLGARRVAVRVHVAQRDLARRAGAGYFEGQHDSTSIPTIERHVCESGSIDVVFVDDGHMNLGREQRLYSPRQRIALAARDGGCLWPRCERPPGWCEAHHINEWTRDHGRTDLIDGVLLCRHHHMLLHNNSWKIHREGTQYWLTPPGAERIALTSKSPVRAG